MSSAGGSSGGCGETKGSEVVSRSQQTGLQVRECFDAEVLEYLAAEGLKLDGNTARAQAVMEYLAAEVLELAGNAPRAQLDSKLPLEVNYPLFDEKV